MILGEMIVLSWILDVEPNVIIKLIYTFKCKIWNHLLHQYDFLKLQNVQVDWRLYILVLIHIFD